MPEFIYTMREVTKVHPPDKKVLSNVTLAFYPGAKIGVIAANGSGKSSLLRVMAGVATKCAAEARRHRGMKMGYFAQGPDLGAEKAVREAVEEVVSETRAMVRKSEKLSMKLGEPLGDDEMNRVL